MISGAFFAKRGVGLRSGVGVGGNCHNELGIEMKRVSYITMVSGLHINK